MRELFYLAATVWLVIAFLLPDSIGSWLQKVDNARYGCDTMACWNTEDPL